MTDIEADGRCFDFILKLVMEIEMTFLEAFLMSLTLWTPFLISVDDATASS